MKKVEEGTFVTNEELEGIQQMNSEFQKMKTTLGDIELQKYSVLKHIDELKKVFMENEKLLIQKYGEDAVINIKTGEITKKEKQDG
jgi:chaperonin cofactor prefoldin